MRRDFHVTASTRAPTINFQVTYNAQFANLSFTLEEAREFAENLADAIREFEEKFEDAT